MQEYEEIEEDNDEVIFDEEYDPEREKDLESQLANQQSGLSSYWSRNHYYEIIIAEKFEKNAGKYWHDFYNRNGNRFFKDRHYLDIVFDILKSIEEKEGSFSLLEVGCGVGNAFLPLSAKYPNLHVYACDFAKSAVEFILAREEYDSIRMSVWQADLVKDDIVDKVPEKGCDLLLIMFVLSAVTPKNMDSFLEHAVRGLRKGGQLLFRDYGRYDMAQIRFKTGRKIENNLYARQDGTLAYFFDLDELEELFSRHGLVKKESKANRRCIRNRKTNTEMHRVWVQCIYEKVE